MISRFDSALFPLRATGEFLTLMHTTAPGRVRAPLLPVEIHDKSILEKVMTQRHYSWISVFALCSAALLGFALFRASGAQAQGQYPIMDKIADKIVQKYQSSSCQQLWEKKSEHAPPSAEEQRAVGILRNDPQMRNAFINRIAPPIANKMFDCGMIP
jgi:hypothetical protein